MPRKPAQYIWCDHCNADINFRAVKGCTRQTCQTKKLVKDIEANASK